jgi:predicted NBD/HSP70 family sugar kinase/mannose-6-phosphate isomerase class I
MFKHIDNTNLSLGVDIGGTHIAAALVADGKVLHNTYRRMPVDPGAEATTILDTWTACMNSVLEQAPSPVEKIGLAIPGPFDYPNGISLIRGLCKYESLYGLNIREALRDRLACANISFANDAACFGLGAAITEPAKTYRKIVAITLGTGFGACFINNKTIVTTGAGVPPNGYLYCIPFQQGMAEDYLSARWLLANYPAKDVKEIATKALTQQDPEAINLFRKFGANLGRFLTPWLATFEADALVIGGSIAGARELFLPTLGQELKDIQIIFSPDTEQQAIAGAASLPEQPNPTIPKRSSRQPLLPKHHNAAHAGVYDIYPVEPLGKGRINNGYAALADWIAEQGHVRIDGYAGIDWHLVRDRLTATLRTKGLHTLWYETAAFLRPEPEIDALVNPFLGPEGSVWGTRTTLTLADLYRPDLLSWQPETHTNTIIILAGTGSGLTNWDTPILYLDLPKNELQYRMRAGSAANLGSTGSGSYKRSYFVDWPILNNYRRAITNNIAIVIDGQHEDNPNWAFFDDIRTGIRSMTTNLIRPRPWFEPGVWGGQWMKQHIPALDKEEINYAWSFECIAPENGILFESDGLLLETAFDWLMQFESSAILGVDADRFGEEFPIRFDFLDTFDGGNLSIQCHPSLDYIQQHFGETITQDETYYILDSKPGAGVYLGFTDPIEPAAFRAALEKSQEANQAIDMEKYVQRLPAHKHDLFLIPNKTIHGSGANNLVLEISATPYIFTFKMYDWMRPDLDGKPRPINIEHAFHNLDFTRKGNSVRQELVSKPQLLQNYPGCKLELLPTHPEHFYSIHRITLTGSTAISTNGRCHLLMLVEGSRLTLTTKKGRTYRCHYAETFIIPAAAESYTIENPDPEPIIIIKAYVK